MSIWSLLDECSSSMDERHVSQRRTTVDLDIAIWVNQTVTITFHNWLSCDAFKHRIDSNSLSRNSTAVVDFESFLMSSWWRLLPLWETLQCLAAAIQPNSAKAWSCPEDLYYSPTLGDWHGYSNRLSNGDAACLPNKTDRQRVRW